MINKKLTKIDIDGKRFYYKVDGGSYEWSWTEFYYTNDKFKTFKILGFPILKYHSNTMAFKVNYDIESCSLKKENVKKYIIKEMTRRDRLRARCNEIKNGGII